MTKAEKIYNATRFDCKRHISNWGYEENIGFNGLSTEGPVSIRTCNDIQKILDSKFRGIEIDRKLGISTEGKLGAEENVLRMVQATLDNNRKSVASFNESLKSI